jgi:hypothetical protein
VSIGRPISNTVAYILDERMLPVPAGVTGELYLGGVGLARGYLGRPELTAERFVPDPFAGGGARMYGTGDLARYLVGGRIAFLGRLDQQVKIRGFRIEIGEVEAVLEQHPDVVTAAVTVRPDSRGEKRLLAYVVPSGDVVTPALLRAWLRQRLPEYMLPSHCMLLDSLPLTPNGKLDRRALPAPEARPLDHVATPPRNDLERSIAEVWQGALGLAEVGVHDSFFELGGHSLLLARVHAELRSRIGGELPLVSLFEHPTISALARCLGGAEPQEAERPHGLAQQPKAGQKRFEELRKRRERLTGSKLS